MIIQERDVDYFTFYQADVTGKMARYKGRYIRIIHKDRVSAVREMFTSGLVQRLMDERLLVGSRISELHFLSDESDLIIEHEDLSPFIEIDELTVSMRIDIANMYLRLLSILLEYGYELHDIHLRNVNFRMNEPVLVDFGSIVPFTQYDLETYRGFIELNIEPIKLIYKGFADIVPYVETVQKCVTRRLLSPCSVWAWKNSRLEQTKTIGRIGKNILLGSEENFRFYSERYKGG